MLRNQRKSPSTMVAVSTRSRWRIFIIVTLSLRWISSKAPWPMDRIRLSLAKVIAKATRVRSRLLFSCSTARFLFVFGMFPASTQLDAYTKSPMEIARCYGCGVTKKAITHQFYGGPIKEEIDLIKDSLTTTGQGPPELTQIGGSKSSKGQSYKLLLLPAQQVVILSIIYWVPRKLSEF